MICAIFSFSIGLGIIALLSCFSAGITMSVAFVKWEWPSDIVLFKWENLRIMILVIFSLAMVLFWKEFDFYE